MTDAESYSELPFDYPDAQPATLAGAKGKRCVRHGPWKLEDYADDDSRVLSVREVCVSCGHPRDTIVAARNRRNRNRGKSTSRDLADYLSGQNVETLNWPWDCQGDGWRIQSKRDALTRGPVAALALIRAIPEGAGYLRGLFHVAPARRLTSGQVTILLEDWIGWHGWTLPPFAGLLLAGEVPLLRLPLATFRDVHIAAAP